MLDYHESWLISQCEKNIDNHFDLTLIASLRARELEHGAIPLVDKTAKKKPTIIALEEVAEGHIGKEMLTKKLK